LRAAAREGQPVTAEQFADLKDQINASFDEVSNLLLDISARQDQIDERLDIYNRKSSHKI
jgi:hypothetical protein